MKFAWPLVLPNKFSQTSAIFSLPVERSINDLRRTTKVLTKKQDGNVGNPETDGRTQFTIQVTHYSISEIGG